MQPRHFRPIAALAVVLSAVLSGLQPACAQQAYHNLVNLRFRTVSDGPQSALILDVKDASDKDAVRRAAVQQAAVFRRSSAMQQELAFLRQHRLLKPGKSLALNPAVMVRQNGQLVQPKPHGLTRAPNQLTFDFPTTGTGAWSQQDATNLQGIVNLLYSELYNNVLGPPAWNGTVTVLNEDPNLGKTDEVIGALLVINGSSVEILFPTFTDYETQFLAMAQVMAQAFHGPDRIAYDAWEQGMARAAAVVAARDLQSQITAAGQTVDPANTFYYTPEYDLLNQPPLGNNTFTPPTVSNQAFNNATLAGMLVPRLQMASTAWLKCYIENPNFFKTFNAAYYAAYAGSANVANDVNQLRSLAASADPTVEGTDFSDWYEQQFVLDTSITPGQKLYSYVEPTFPTTATSDDGGAAIFVVYYTTTATGDEMDSNGTSNVVYWDYTLANQLTLPSFQTITISNGFGTVAPYFTNIGGNPADKMRVAIDIPVNRDYVRVYFPAGETGSETQPNDFSGVVIGANSGALSAAFEGGSGAISAPVVQGDFGGAGVPNGFSRTRITFTPTGGQAVSFQRNTYQRPTTATLTNVAPTFILNVPGTVATLSHTFAAGLQMIALPVTPLTSNLASVLGTNPNATLLAQYRQDLATTDKYMRYPTLPLYQPGYGLWIDQPTSFTASNIQGQATDNQQSLSVALEYGWNQIGSPYSATLDATSDLQFSYQGDTPVSLADAVSNQWIAAGIIGYSSTTGYIDITTSTNSNFPQNQLLAWQGYWIRVLVTEGLTMTCTNPNYRVPNAKSNLTPRPPSLPARSSLGKGESQVKSSPFPVPVPIISGSAANAVGKGAGGLGKTGKRKARSVASTSSSGVGVGGWRVPLALSDNNGHTAAALFGQSPNGSDSFVGALDVASPPPFTGASPPLTILFPHDDWAIGPGSAGGNFMADIRRSAASSQWNVVVTVPQGGQNYSLTWGNTAKLPRGSRLTLTDTTTGAQQIMNSTSSMSFSVPKGQLTHQFKIQVEPRTVGHLFITNVAALPVGGGGRAVVRTLTITYELSEAAESSLTIRSAGRAVRHLATGRAAPSGVNQMVWDTKDDQGRSLPGGLYTLEVAARTSEGEVTRTVVPLLLTR